MEKSNRILPWLVFSAALVIALIHLDAVEFLMIDTRFAMFIHEAGEHGFGAFPRIFGRFYPDYTSFPTYLAYGTAQLFGGTVNMLTAVLPTAVASALTVLLTFLLGRRMVSERFGLTAALLLLGSYSWIEMSRQFSMDFYSAFFTISTFYLLWCSETEKKAGLVYGIIPLLVLSYLMRGPFGVVHPAGVMFFFFLIAKRPAKAFISGMISFLILCGMLGLWYYLAKTYGHPNFEREFLNSQFGGPMADKWLPPWFYLTHGLPVFAFAFPLALISIIGFILHFKKKAFIPSDDRMERDFQYCAGWFFVIVIGMSIPGSKHLRYILPAMPAAALIAAYIFDNPREIPWCDWIRRVLSHLATFIPGFCILGLIIANYILAMPKIREKTGVPLHIDLLIPCIILTVVQILMLISLKYSKYIRGSAALISFMLIFAAIRISVAEPIEFQTMSSAEFAKKVEARRPDCQFLHFLDLGIDGDEIKYMVHVKRSRKFIPAYILPLGKTFLFHRPGFYSKNLPVENLLALEPGTLMITRQDRWKNYPGKIRKGWVIREQGRIGRRNCILLERTAE